MIYVGFRNLENNLSSHLNHKVAQEILEMQQEMYGAKDMENLFEVRYVPLEFIFLLR